METEPPSAVSEVPFDSDNFRRVLGHFPTGVVVVAGITPAGPTGLAIGSFTSLSLDPPLVLFCPAKSSRTWPRLESVGAFCVNALGHDQEHLSRTFSGRSEDRFAGVNWRPSPLGSPILEGALAWVDCTTWRIDEGGDHWIVIGRVADLGVETSRGPLVFFRGGYLSPQPPA